jgi:hypothetical protein
MATLIVTHLEGVADHIAAQFAAHDATDIVVIDGATRGVLDELTARNIAATLILAPTVTTVSVEA